LPHCQVFSSQLHRVTVLLFKGVTKSTGDFCCIAHNASPSHTTKPKRVGRPRMAIRHRELSRLRGQEREGTARCLQSVPPARVAAEPPCVLQPAAPMAGSRHTVPPYSGSSPCRFAAWGLFTGRWFRCVVSVSSGALLPARRHRPCAGLSADGGRRLVCGRCFECSGGARAVGAWPYHVCTAARWPAPGVGAPGMRQG